MLPIVAPLYGRYVLGINSGFIRSLLLGVAFISAAIFMIYWQKFSVKNGVKKTQIAAMFAFLITLSPFMLIFEIIGGVIVFCFLGIGLAGVLFSRAVIISTIIDKDEIKTGLRREGSYYGVNALLTRLTTIAVFLTINLVFNYVGWTTFEPLFILPWQLEQYKFGLRILVFVFPAIALGIGLLSMTRFPITKENYEKIKEDIIKIHEKKKYKVNK